MSQTQLPRMRVEHCERAITMEYFAIVEDLGCRTWHRTCCVALASIASNTGFSSPGEELITCSTSEAASLLLRDAFGKIVSG